MKKLRKIIIILVVLIILAGLGIGIGVFLIKKSQKETDEDFDTERLYLENLYEKSIEYSADEDTDEDGLSDYDEYYLYKTNPYAFDSDMDGLSDYDEIMEYYTSPTNADTDNDTLSDGCEIMVGLNPLKVKTDGITPDANIKFDKSYSYLNAVLDVNGNASISDIYFNTFNTAGLNSTYGLVSEVYEIYTEGSFDEAVLSIKYDSNVIDRYNYDEDMLSIYQFDNNGDWIQVESYVDKENKVISAVLQHFSKYAICDSSKILENKQAEIEVFYVIDDSGSMYDGGDWFPNDVEFKRFDFVDELTRELGSDVKVGMGIYTGTYYPILDLGASLEEIETKTSELRQDRNHNFNGTGTIDAAYKALDNFESGIASRKFMVILTDGDDNCSRHNSEELIEKANEMNVTIIVIGLGSMINVDRMVEITSNTSGEYVYVNNSDAIERVYNKIMNLLYYNFVDVNGDNIDDAILIADSNFDVNVDGLSFSNPVVKIDDYMGGGFCYGIAMLCQLNHLGIVPKEIPELSMTDYDIWLLRLIASAISDDIYMNSVSGINNETLKYLGFEESNGYMRMENLNEGFRSNITDLDVEIDNMAILDKYEVNDDKEIVYTDKVKEMYGKNTLLRTRKINKTVLFVDDTECKSYELLCYNFDEADYSGEYVDDVLDTGYIMYILLRLWAEQFNDDSNIVEYAPKYDWDTIVASVQSGIALGVNINDSHEVNLIRIVRDIDNPYFYKLVVYDNNYPGQEIEYTVFRKWYEKYDWVGFIWDENFDLISMTFQDFTHNFN